MDKIKFSFLIIVMIFTIFQVNTTGTVVGNVFDIWDFFPERTVELSTNEEIIDFIQPNANAGDEIDIKDNFIQPTVELSSNEENNPAPVITSVGNEIDIWDFFPQLTIELSTNEINNNSGIATTTVGNEINVWDYFPPPAFN